jgi:predicted naringenin-chalcone synthase
MLHSSLLANAPRLAGFKIVRPMYERSQQATLAWLARAHTEAERAASDDPGFDAVRFHEEIHKRLARFGCSPESIARRGYEIPDIASSRWDEMLIYDFALGPEGAGTQARTQAFARVTDRVLDRLYDEPAAEAPRDLLHVTCTGYASPSAAQRLVSRRSWGKETRVLHAYQMGCYAALPAVRVAAALAGARPVPPKRVDVVHTEICSLHLRPRQHEPEQLVVQSLFADGHVRYSVVGPGEAAQPSFALLGGREEILADSADAMTWVASDAGMEMTLARDLPRRIAGSVRAFVAQLHADVGLDGVGCDEDTVFAVHPGGPRVIDAVQSALELAGSQVAASRAVLSRYGNMSSATLPHVWKALLDAREVPPGTRVVSLAFGPGLTMAGAVMVKT